MIPQAVPSLGPLERQYLLEAIDSGFVSTAGPFVPRFESALAEAVGADSSVATSSGTAALHLALLAAGVQPDDLVICPSYTFIASANAIRYCQAHPWFVAVDPATWNLDPRAVARALADEVDTRSQGRVHRASGRRVGAVLAVYTLGLPADMDAFAEIGRETGLPIVADAAAACGARASSGRELASLADLSAFSFNGNKTITTGGGGAVVARDRDALDRARHLANVARRGPDYEYDAVGFNYRMTNLHAAVGCAQLERRNELVGAKRRIRAAYDDAFASLSGARPFPRADEGQSACWLSGMLARSPGPDASALRDALSQAGIEAREFWQPLHLQAPYRSCPKSEGEHGESFWSDVVVLPSSADLTDGDQALAIDTVRRAYGTPRS